MAQQERRSLEWLRTAITGVAIALFGTALATGDVVIPQHNVIGWVLAALGVLLLGAVIVGVVRRRSGAQPPSGGREAAEEPRG